MFKTVKIGVTLLGRKKAECRSQVGSWTARVTDLYGQRALRARLENWKKKKTKWPREGQLATKCGEKENGIPGCVCHSFQKEENKVAQGHVHT